MTIEEKYNQIIAFIKQYAEETNAKGYVLGISGGKDSMIVAKLLIEAVGYDKVTGILMPNGVQNDINDSFKVITALDINYIIFDIQNIYNDILNKGKDMYFITNKAKTNIPPRIRMTILYAIAQSFGYHVAGTSNKSEAFIGWCTKWGDTACDINPIAHLTCSEVIELGDYLNLPYQLVHKLPADGLTGKTDEENFGFTYSELDNLIKKQEDLLSTGVLSSPYTDTELKILEMHEKAYHKDHVININNCRRK